MNVLLSVFECNPLRGSDSYVGWSYVINAAKYNNVYALTRTANKADIEIYTLFTLINPNSLQKKFIRLITILDFLVLTLSGRNLLIRRHKN